VPEGRGIEVRSLSIIIPAYNAEAHLLSVVERIPAPLWPNVANVWVVDDGSIDKTGTILDALGNTNSKIRPIHFDRNRGYGAALKEGLCRCRNDGCAVAVCLHADGQYPPEMIPGALELMHQKSFDIMQGSRIASGTALSGGMPLYKFLANRALTFLENRVYGLSMTDYHSGMLFYSRSDSFDFDVEIIASARARGLAIGEVPVPTHYGAEISHVQPMLYGIRVLGIMRKYMIGRYSVR
jgi:glycosyltransferase involved in cell wall biosynthesis